MSEPRAQSRPRLREGAPPVAVTIPFAISPRVRPWAISMMLVTVNCTSPDVPTTGDAGGTGSLCLVCQDVAIDVPIVREVGGLLSVCAGDGCHNHGAGNLVISGVDDFRSLIGVQSSEMPGLRRVEPGDPAQSYMYLKVACEGGIVLSCMPPGFPLSLAQVQAIHDWIEAGAPTQ